MADTDKLTAALAAIRQREGWATDHYSESAEQRASLADVPRLLAAVDAVLALAEVYDDGDSLLDPAAAIRAAVGKALGVTDG